MGKNCAQRALGLSTAPSSQHQAGSGGTTGEDSTSSRGGWGPSVGELQSATGGWGTAWRATHSKYAADSLQRTDNTNGWGSRPSTAWGPSRSQQISRRSSDIDREINPNTLQVSSLGFTDLPSAGCIGVSGSFELVPGTESTWDSFEAPAPAFSIPAANRRLFVHRVPTTAVLRVNRDGQLESTQLNQAITDTENILDSADEDDTNTTRTNVSDLLSSLTQFREDHIARQRQLLSWIASLEQEVSNERTEISNLRRERADFRNRNRELTRHVRELSTFNNELGGIVTCLEDQRDAPVVHASEVNFADVTDSIDPQPQAKRQRR